MRPMSRSDPRADGATELEALKADSFGRIALMRGADGVRRLSEDLAAGVRRPVPVP